MVCRLRTALLMAMWGVGLSACGHVPITSLYALWKIDFETTDPAKIRAAIKVPRMIKPRPGGMHLRIIVKTGEAPEVVEDFALVEVTDQDELRALDYALDLATSIYAYRILDKDVARLEAFRSTLMQKKQSGTKGTLTISVVPEACRTGPLPRGSLLFSTYLRTSETGAYVPLTADVDLRTLDAKRDIAALIPVCAAPVVPG